MPGGSRRLDIVYHIDTAQADAQADAFNQRQMGREKKLLTDEEAAAAARRRLVDQTNQAKINSILKEQAAEEQKLKNILTKEEVAEKAKEALYQRYNQKRIELASYEMRAEDEVLRVSMAAMDKKLAKYQVQNKAIGESVAAIGKMGAAMLGLQGAQQVLGVISDTFAKTQQHAFEAAKSIEKIRGDVRELQALRGEVGGEDQFGRTGPGIAHVFDIAKDTLQSIDDVQKMESAGLGVGELALKNDADREQFTKAMVAAGRFQMLEGGDAGAYGQMMGQIALQSKGPLNAEDMEAQAWRLFKIQQPGGFRNNAQAMGQYAKLNPLVANGIYSPEEAMGLLSAFSVSSPDEAATKVEQFTRSVLAGRLKGKGQSVSPDVDTMKTFEYMKGLGISDKDNALGMGRKISADIAAQQAAAAKAGQSFNAHDYLLTRGFSNQEDRLAIMDLAGLLNNGRMDKIQGAMDAPLERGAISRRFADRAATDNFYKARRNQLVGEAAKAREGLGEEPLVLAQEAAFNRLKAQGKIGGSFEDWQRIERGGLSGSAEAGIQDMFRSNYHSQVTREMMHSLESERKRLGGDRIFPGITEGAHDYELRFAREIQSRGGDVTAGSSEDMQKLTQALNSLTDEMKKRPGQNGPPAPMPGRPAIQAARP